jgi:hypothetical protein
MGDSSADDLAERVTNLFGGSNSRQRREGIAGVMALLAERREPREPGFDRERLASLAERLQIHLDMSGTDEELLVQFNNLRRIEKQMTQARRQAETTDLEPPALVDEQFDDSEDSDEWASLAYASATKDHPGLKTRYDFPFADYPVDISRGRAFKTERQREKHEYDGLWVMAHKSAQGLNSVRPGSTAFLYFKEILTKAERRILALTQWNDIGYQFLVIYEGYAEQRGVAPVDAFFKAKIAYAKEQSRTRAVSKGPVSSSSSQGPVAASLSVSSASRYSGGSSRVFSSNFGNQASSSVTPKGGKGKGGAAGGKNFPEGSCFSCGSWDHWALSCPRPKQW